jgi:hypothetical protein
MRLPVAATKFAAAYSYELPGEPLYGPSPFNEYFCTEQQAKNAGFRHSVLTPAGRQEQQAELDQQDGYVANKSDFITYSPTFVPARFTKGDMVMLQIHGEKQVTQKLSTGSSDMALMRQALQTPISMDEWLCHGAACKVIGSDSHGRQVYKWHKTYIKTTYWGVLLDKTYFQIEAEDSANMTDQEAIQILGSLAPAE